MPLASMWEYQHGTGDVAAQCGHFGPHNVGASKAQGVMISLGEVAPDDRGLPDAIGHLHFQMVCGDTGKSARFHKTAACFFRLKSPCFFAIRIANLKMSIDVSECQPSESYRQ